MYMFVFILFIFITFLYFLWIHNLLTQVSSRSAELGHNSEGLDTKGGVASRDTSQTAVQSDDPGKAELSRRKWLCWLAALTAASKNTGDQLPPVPAYWPFIPTSSPSLWRKTSFRTYRAGFLGPRYSSQLHHFDGRKPLHAANFLNISWSGFFFFWRLALDLRADTQDGNSDTCARRFAGNRQDPHFR